MFCGPAGPVYSASRFEQVQRPMAVDEPECEPEVVFSSQELEAELEAQLELEGWL